MTLFKNSISITKVLFLLVPGIILSSNLGAMAQEVKSDYEIQQDFKKQYNEINNKLTEADNTAVVNEIIERVKTLEKNYTDHRELLNVALHPETFSSEMEDLKRRALAAKNQLATIEQQEEKLQELTQQVTSYDTRLEDLNKRTDSLRNAMQKSLNSEKQLTGMVRRYRESLEQRDELILSFVDSVMITYQKLQVETMQDLENAKKKARFNADGNALKMIMNIADENISLLNTGQDLTAGDYLRMSAVQHKFKNMWEKVGDKLVEIYAEGDKQKAKENISNALAEWNEEVTSKTWTSLNASFDSAGINLPKFNDSETFYRTLDSYLSESIKASEKGSGGTSLKNYKEFSSFWSNRVQADWTPFMIEANVLSNEQMASIDSRLVTWASNAEPDSNNMLIYLLGFSILAIIALGIILFREKKASKA